VACFVVGANDTCDVCGTVARYCVNSADEGAVCESNILNACPNGLIPHSSNANSCTDADECAAYVALRRVVVMLLGYG